MHTKQRIKGYTLWSYIYNIKGGNIALKKVSDFLKFLS